MEENNNSLKKYLSPLGVWALSFGCSVGWGAFVMPGTTFLPVAGPLGTALGISVGAVIMLIIGRNYCFLMNRYPDAGGTYTYSKNILGYDHGFLSAWFLVLTYVVIIWANLTALALIGRNLLGDMFQFGFHYQLAGYDIYFGEIAAAIVVLLLCGAFCMFRKRIAMWIQILMALILIGGIVLCFIFAASRSEVTPLFEPSFSDLSSSGKSMQLVSIVALMPWAYVGFESVSHSAEELKFKKNKTFIIIIVSVCTAGLAYILLSLLAVTALPEGYSSWTSYIADLGNLSGAEALPTFYAIKKAMGDTGIIILGVTVLGGIITGIIGNMVASSRVLYAISKDDILPKWFSKTNRDGNPSNAILFITLLSMIIPFFGRTAISWIVDVTTIGGIIIYCYTSAAALKEALREKNKGMTVCGLIGVVLSLAFALYFLIPNISPISTLGTESYFILTLWSILGLIFFRRILRKDTKHRFGRSIIVWIVLIFLIMFTSIIWMQQANNKAVADVQDNIVDRYSAHIRDYHPEEARRSELEVERYVDTEMSQLSLTLMRNNLVRIFMIVVAVGILFLVYTLMTKRQRELDRVRNIAFKDTLTGVGNSYSYQQTEINLDKEIQGGYITSFAIAVCDLNGLKRINDTKGHSKGDEYIRQACGIICDIFSHSPVYRIGGDEFVIVLRGRDFDNREELLKKISEINTKNKDNEEAVIAIGIAEYEPEKDKSVDAIFTRADKEMYKNKKQLKNE